MKLSNHLFTNLERTRLSLSGSDLENVAEVWQDKQKDFEDHLFFLFNRGAAAINFGVIENLDYLSTDTPKPGLPFSEALAESLGLNILRKDLMKVGFTIEKNRVTHLSHLGRQVSDKHMTRFYRFDPDKFAKFRLGEGVILNEIYRQKSNGKLVIDVSQLTQILGEDYIQFDQKRRSTSNHLSSASKELWMSVIRHSIHAADSLRFVR